MTLEQVAEMLQAAAEGLSDIEASGPSSTELAVAALHAELAAINLHAHMEGKRGKTLVEVFVEEAST